MATTVAMPERVCQGLAQPNGEPVAVRRSGRLARSSGGHTGGGHGGFAHSAVKRPARIARNQESGRQIKMTTRGEPRLAEATVEELRATLRGELIGPDDAAYEESRKVYNGMIDRGPAAIVRCADVADVIVAVGLARDL